MVYTARENELELALFLTQRHKEMDKGQCCGVEWASVCNAHERGGVRQAKVAGVDWKVCLQKAVGVALE